MSSRPLHPREPDGWQDTLRRTGRCTACAQHGVALKRLITQVKMVGFCSQPRERTLDIVGQSSMPSPRRGSTSSGWSAMAGALARRPFCNATSRSGLKARRPSWLLRTSALSPPQLEDALTLYLKILLGAAVGDAGD